MASERWLCPSCGAKSDPSPETPPGCSRCDAPLHVGKFGLLEEIEGERSARVFLGRESSGRAEVTVRIFPENLELDVALLRQAVKRAAPLSHPLIVAPLDAGTHRNQPYFVEAAAPGVSVTRADLALHEAVGVIRNVALALDYAHGRGIVHPDLRAENVRVAREAGRSLGESSWRVSVTCFGIAGGGSVRDNVAALGEILYAATTGREPRDLAPEAPSSINPLVDSELESIILTAMNSTGSRQPPSMEQLAAELARWLDGGTPSPAARKDAPAAVPEPRARQPWKTWGILGLSGAAVLLLLFLVFRKGSPKIDPVPVVRVPPGQMVEPPRAKPEEPPPVAPPPPPPSKPDPAPPVKVEPVPSPAEPFDAAQGKPEPPKPAPAIKPEEKPAPVVVAPPAPVPPPPKPPEEKPAPPPPPPPAPAPGVDVGAIFRIHPSDGVFVKLSGTHPPAPGDLLEAVRKGEVVAKLKVKEVTPPERRYPRGCAVCLVESGSPAQEDTIRKASR